MALAIVILVMLLTLAYFYLKCSMMESFATLWSLVVTTIITFTYYEWAAGLFTSVGYGLDWAKSGCYIILFVVSFALLRTVSEYLIGITVELGNTVKVSTALVCGILAGLILSGNILIALGGLWPLHGKIFYSRFDPANEASVSVQNPKKPAMATDGFVTGLYRQISAGSMSGKKSFGVFHADYLTQIHLNKLKTKDGINTVCSHEALVLPGGKEQKPVRLQSVDDKEVMLIRMGLKTAKISEGGTRNASGNFSFFPGQICLIVKEATSQEKPLEGTAAALYPVGLWNPKNRKLTLTKLNEVLKPDAKNEQVYWMDVAFEVPERMKPVLLQFRQNAAVELAGYEAVKNSPEIEQALNKDEQEKEEDGSGT